MCKILKMSKGDLRIFGLKQNTEKQECLLPGADVRYCEALFDYSPIPMALISNKLEWIKVNAKLCELTNFSENELIGKECSEITHPKDIGPDRAMMKTLINKEHVEYSIVKRFLSKTGKVIWCDFSIFGIYKQENKEELYFSIAWINPVPNNGNFKIVQNKEKGVEIRPSITVPQFVIDNWKYFVPALAFLGGFIMWVAKYYHVWQQVIEKLGIKP